VQCGVRLSPSVSTPCFRCDTPVPPKLTEQEQAVIQKYRKSKSNQKSSYKKKQEKANQKKLEQANQNKM
jgi:hypothetical protein